MESVEKRTLFTLGELRTLTVILSISERQIRVISVPKSRMLISIYSLVSYITFVLPTERILNTLDLSPFPSANLNTHATMNPTNHTPTTLQPLPVILSALHLPPGLSTLHTISGIEISLPKSETSAPITFKAIITESTNVNLLLKSFYYSNVHGKAFDGSEYILSSLAEQGISRCAFTSTFGILKGQPSLHDDPAPQFKVDGLSHVPFTHQGYFFSPAFLICDHIFCRQEYETEFVAVLGLAFLREYFIQTKYNKKGWKIQLPPSPPTQTCELPIYTNGCCLSNRGGYGIHFPTLPNGWDMYGALGSGDSHTNQKAELTALIRALQLVRLRKVPCTSISIFTDSKYAVQGLNEDIPNLWRSNGYRTAKDREVINADLFRSLDEEVALSINCGIRVTLSHVARNQNKDADALAKRGAVSGVPSMTIGNPNKGSNKEAGVQAIGETGKEANQGAKAKVNGSIGQNGRPEMLLGKNALEKIEPLVQWTPDGEYWARWQSINGSDESPTTRMEMLVI